MKIELNQTETHQLFAEIEAAYQAVSGNDPLPRETGEFTTREYRAWLAEKGYILSMRAVQARLVKMLDRKLITRRMVGFTYLWKMNKE